MSEWKNVTIDQCTDILDNLRIPVNEEERSKDLGTTPYYGANGLQGHINGWLFDEPLILMAEDGGYFDEWFNRPVAYKIAGKSWVNNHAHILRPKPAYDFNFIFYSLEHKDILPFIKGGTRAKLNQKELREIPIQCPNNRYIQQKIATILSTIDRAIENTEALIEKYQQIKTGLMHDLFTRGIGEDGKLRPPRTEAPELYKETEIGWIPREWELLPLKIILKNTGGYLQTGPFGSQLHSHEYLLEGIPVIMPQDINDGKIWTGTIARISENRAKQLQKHRLKIGDVIIARRGELCRAAAVGGKEKLWVCGTGCFLLRLGGSKLNPDFFSFIYRHPFIQRQVEGLAVGSTMPSLNNEIMGKLIFPAINELEQTMISNKIEAAENSINKLVLQVSKLQSQKTGLMHDLLTGKVKVEVTNPKYPEICALS